MSKIPRKQWTPEETEFEKYVRLNGSKIQMERIEGRLGMWRMERELRAD